ncbi:hypothetical protein GN157_09410, partial [Flavobacterium rakeshii]
MKKIAGNLFMLFMLFTAMSSYSQLAQEGFEDTSVWPPTGWNIYNNGIGPVQAWKRSELGNDALPPHEGSYAALIEKENVIGDVPAQDWLVTPLVLLPNNAQLRFFSRLSMNGDDGSLYRIMVSTDADPSNLTAYTQVEEWTELQINPIQQEYTEIVVSLSSFAASTNVYIAFVMEGDDGDRWLVDNVSVTEECIAPTNLAADNIGTETADLSWDAGLAGEWEVEVLPTADVPTGTGVSVTGTAEFNATLLTENTDYKFYVKTICEEDVNESNWAGPFFFTTVGLGDTCAAPIEITSLPYSATDNTSNYGDDYSGSAGSSGCGSTSSYLDGDDVVYAYTPASDGVISLDLDDLGTYVGVFIYDDCADIGNNCLEGVVSGFTSQPLSLSTIAVTGGTTYYIVISTWASPQSTPYTLTVQQVNCPPPTGLSASNMGLASADLTWDANGSTSWEVVVQEEGAGIPAGAGTTTTVSTDYNVTTEFDSTPLVSATNYEYYVRADCGDGTFSTWSGPFVFSTTVCDAADQCTYTFVLTDSYGDGWNGNTISVLQNDVEVAVLGPGFTGSGPYEVNVQVCNDMPIEIFWNSGGSYAYEVGLIARNGFNQDFYTKPSGTGSQNTSLYTGTVDCDEPLCIAPVGITVSNETTTSVDLSWNDVPGSYEYFYVEAGEPAPSATDAGTTTTETSVTINDLDPSTNYDFYVRYVCADDSLTDWAGPTSAHTNVCDPVDQCTFTFEMTSEAGTGWQGNTMTVSQGGVEIQVIGSSFTWGTSATVDIPLCPDVDIEVYWNTSGSNPADKGLIIYSQYEDIYSKPAGLGEQGTIVIAGTVSCDEPTCPKPQNITLISTTSSSATFSWDEMGDAGTWEVWALPSGSPAPTEAGEETTQNPHTVTGLDSATEYVFYVRANCGDADGYSTWTGPFSFISAIENDECDGAVMTPVNTTYECVDFTEVSFLGATASTEPVCTGVNGGDVWYEFVAGDPTHIITLSNFEVGNASAQPFVLALYEDFCGDALGEPLYCSENNAINALGLTVGATYKIRISLNSTTPNNSLHVSDLCITTPDSNGNGASQCLVTTINSDFEEPLFDLGGWAMFHQNAVPGWRTTATDGMIEYWGDGFNDVPAYSGNQFIELNANQVAGVYQDYVAPPGTVFEYGFAHRGRMAVETCQLKAGPPGGPYLPVGDPVSTGTTDWSYNTGTYIVPAGQDVTRFIFESVPTAGDPTIGNFLDAVTFNANTGIVTPSPLNIDCSDPVANIEAIGGGTWVAYDNNPSTTLIEDPNSNVTTITGFTVPGDYYFEWSTPFCNSTLVITYSTIDIPAPVVSNVMYCEGAVATALTAEILEGYTINWYDSEDGVALTEAPTPDTSIAGTTTYYVSQSNENGCESPRAAIEVSVIAIPVADVIEDVTDCDAFVLPTLSENNNYYTGPDGTGDMLAAGDELTEGQTVYIFAQAPGTDCSSESSFVVNIVPTPIISVNQGCEGGIYMLEVTLDDNYTEATVNIDWTDASGATIGTGLTATATEIGVYTVTVTPVGGDICSSSFELTVDNVACMIPKGISPNGDTM